MYNMADVQYNRCEYLKVEANKQTNSSLISM